MKKMLGLMLSVMLFLLLSGCASDKGWKKEELTLSKYTEADMPGYITAQVVTENISEKNYDVTIELTRTGEEKIRGYNTAMSAEVNLDGQWYTAPRLTDDYMLEEAPFFSQDETNSVWVDLRTFDMRPGTYRVLVQYMLENDSAYYYAPAQFTYE